MHDIIGAAADGERHRAGLEYCVRAANMATRSAQQVSR
jgi:hypothetical protein